LRRSLWQITRRHQKGAIGSAGQGAHAQRAQGLGDQGGRIQSDTSGQPIVMQRLHGPRFFVWVALHQGLQRTHSHVHP
jgi:hypothetical protein